MQIITLYRINLECKHKNLLRYGIDRLQSKSTRRLQYEKYKQSYIEIYDQRSKLIIHLHNNNHNKIINWPLWTYRYLLSFWIEDSYVN